MVGRGGMAALQDKPDVLHVRIQAPLELRVKRLKEFINSGYPPSEAGLKAYIAAGHGDEELWCG